MAGRPSLDDLARRCGDETRKYVRHEPSDPAHCLDLLRRALAEDDPEAFAQVYRVYQSQVLRWVYRHPGFARADENADFFANAALNRFYFALRGARFALFPALPQILAYLKACVHTAIAQYLRDQQKLAVLALEDAGELPAPADSGSQVEADELWAYILHMLPDEADQRLAQAAFVWGMRPAQITAANWGPWKSEREISIALYRIRRRLRGDATLRARLGLASDAALEAA